MKVRGWIGGCVALGACKGKRLNRSNEPDDWKLRGLVWIVCKKEISDKVHRLLELVRIGDKAEADPQQDITRSFIHTTSNLRKIEKLIAEDSPVVRLQPGELIVRLSYGQRKVSEPLISTVSQTFHISLNIISGMRTISFGHVGEGTSRACPNAPPALPRKHFIAIQLA